MAAAVDAAGAALGALGMLAFAIVFSLTAEISIATAFMGASVAWLTISLTAWYVRRKARSVRRARTEQRGSGSAMRRSR
jgi:ABC-type Fe3+-siderophore transport system permease subunit